MSYVFPLFYIAREHFFVIFERVSTSILMLTKSPLIMYCYKHGCFCFSALLLVSCIFLLFNSYFHNLFPAIIGCISFSKTHLLIKLMPYSIFGIIFHLVY